MEMRDIPDLKYLEDPDLESPDSWHSLEVWKSWAELYYGNHLDRPNHQNLCEDGIRRAEVSREENQYARHR